MSTRIGIIAEGPIDHVLVSALLERISRERASFTWPLDCDDLADILPIRKRGHGGVLKTIERLVETLDSTYYEHACFVIVLDRNTKPVQQQIRKLIAGKERFVLGIAIEEIEAWWLGDRTNTLAWSGLADNLPPTCRYSRNKYVAEKDDAPKVTLNELTKCSDRFDRCYGRGSLDLAREFADEYWRRDARLNEIATQCPRGFAPFQNEMATQFKRIKNASGRLF